MESTSTSWDQLARLPEAAAGTIAGAAAALTPRRIPAPRPGPEPVTGPGTGELAALDQRAAAAHDRAGRPRRIEHLATPTSPVGRTNADPRTGSPLHRLATRLGRPLIDLGGCTDAELHALAGLVLGEQHRRASRWFDTT